MSFYGKYVPETPDEYNDMKQYLESLGQFEESLTFHEMKDLTQTLENSLQEGMGTTSNMQNDWDQDLGYLFETVRNEKEENWDNVSCASTHVYEECKTLLVEVDVHHDQNWDPEEDLKQKLEKISMSETRCCKRRNRSASEFSRVRQLDAIDSAIQEEMDPEKKRTLKRKRRISCGEPVFSFED